MEPNQDTPERNGSKAIVECIVESTVVSFIMSIFTLWALFGNDIRLAATGKEADYAFEVIISVIFFCFFLEIFAASYYKIGYLNIPNLTILPEEGCMGLARRITHLGSFYFWLDLIATLTLLLEMNWVIGNGLQTTSPQQANTVQTGSRAGRVLRLVRMVRLVRLVKLYKYLSSRSNKVEVNELHVGAAMSDLTNRRVIVLILSMLIIIPTLTVTQIDSTASMVTEMVHKLAFLNQSNPAVYETAAHFSIYKAVEASAVRIQFNSDSPIFQNEHLIDVLRPGVETEVYQSKQDDFVTTIVFDTKFSSIQNALFSIYTTIFVLCLLLLATYFFSSDVNNLVIRPIECMVELVKKISENPLGVKYEMLGEEEGFVEGMETTVLLSTITKIGGLMCVGFGEAGASIIANNLNASAGGRLNLMGGGVMIESIFGFCDVRNFTDTTECLQEEVMLFVNRIAHILHSIVVQCSGSANKNIGDAFLLTWKLEQRLSDDERASLADQALLAFCKTLVELIRYEEFIVNFSTAATARLYKRFPDYHVRIGSGLHVGWAIEGAIGSDRKIDASYLSPHVNFTEFLESSTKAYGVPLLMSEPFHKLLSPSVQSLCRQVDRVRRSEQEEPVGLYTYDSDISINFADSNRKRHKAATSEGKPKGRRGSLMVDSLGENRGADGHGRPKMKRGSVAIINTAGDGKRGSLVAITDTGKRNSVAVADKKSRDREDEELGSYHQSPGATPVIVVPLYRTQLWDTDMDLVELRHMITEPMRVRWSLGIQAYIQGNWDLAERVFAETLHDTDGLDGPSKFLLSVIKNDYGGDSQHWHGFRIEGSGH